LIFPRRFATCLVALTLPLAGGNSAAGTLAWSAAHTSPAISRTQQSIVVEYAAAPAIAQVSGLARIERVHASVSYRSGAQVQTQLCWNGTSRCVPMIAGQFNTDAFKGLDAAKPLYLVHRVPGEGLVQPPLFVKGEVIVWYTP